MFLEYIDNFWQAIKEIDLFEVVKALSDGWSSFVSGLAELPGKIWDYLADVNPAELGYFIGYLAANIAEFFIPVLKVAKLAKTGKFGKAFDEIAASMVKLETGAVKMAKGMGRGAINTILDFIDKSIEILRGGTEAIKESIALFFKKLRQWLDEGVGRSQKHLDELGRKKMDDINKALLKNQNCYDPNKPALKKRGIKIPKSANGLAPDFAKTAYIYPATGQQKNIVKVKLTGIIGEDFDRANFLGGFVNKPSKYTWHHLDDFDPVSGESTFQLVETIIHQRTGPHIGSVKQYELFYAIKYR